jgi:hypothetical protein
MGQGEGTVKLSLRIPASLHHTLQEQARENRRSLNTEIVHVINDGLATEQSIVGRVHELEQAWDSLSVHATWLETYLLAFKDGLLKRLPPETKIFVGEAVRTALNEGTLGSMLQLHGYRMKENGELARLPS